MSQEIKNAETHDGLITKEQLDDRIKDAEKEVKDFCSYGANSYGCGMAAGTRDTLLIIREMMYEKTEPLA